MYLHARMIKEQEIIDHMLYCILKDINNLLSLDLYRFLNSHLTLTILYLIINKLIVKI